MPGLKPEYLLAVVAVILAARVVLTLRSRMVAGSTGRSMIVAKEYLDPFIVAGLAAWVLITFVARTYYIPSASMVPTLLIHDVLVVDKISYRLHPPHDGDIAVFPPPEETDEDYIKRVMGQPGDTLRITNGVLYRNGAVVPEPFIAKQGQPYKDENGQTEIAMNPNYNLEIRDYGIYVQDTGGGDSTWQRLDPSQANIPPKSQWLAPDRIPPHCYFMMGDDRGNSEDSHMWGFAQDSGTFYGGPRKGAKAGFTGRAIFIFYPFNRIRILHRT